MACGGVRCGIHNPFAGCNPGYTQDYRMPYVQLPPDLLKEEDHYFPRAYELCEGCKWYFPNYTWKIWEETYHEDLEDMETDTDYNGPIHFVRDLICDYYVCPFCSGRRGVGSKRFPERPAGLSPEQLDIAKARLDHGIGVTCPDDCPYCVVDKSLWTKLYGAVFDEPEPEPEPAAAAESQDAAGSQETPD